MTFDEIRVRYPKLGFALYAYEPGDPITLEVHAAYNETFIWTGPTLASVLEQAFKPVVSESPAAASSQLVKSLSPPESAPVGTGDEDAPAAGDPKATGGVFD